MNKKNIGSKFDDFSKKRISLKRYKLLQLNA